MIPISLVDSPINLSEFNIFSSHNLPVLFLGFFIKNEYDNKRLNISDKYNPIKIILFEDSEKTDSEKTVTPLYGVLLKPNQTVIDTFKTIKQQNELGEMNLSTYKNILSQYGLSCDETYHHFSKKIYPVDFTNLKSVCTDKFSSDKKIFQHLLSIDETQFNFQSFASLKLLILNS